MKRHVSKLFFCVMIQTVIIFAFAEIMNMISDNAAKWMFADGFQYVLFVQIAVPLLKIVFYMTLGFSTIYIFRVCPLWRDSGKGARMGYIALLIFTAGMMCLRFLSMIGNGAFYAILVRTKLEFFIQNLSFAHIYATLFIAMLLPNFTEKQKKTAVVSDKKE